MLGIVMRKKDAWQNKVLPPKIQKMKCSCTERTNQKKSLSFCVWSNVMLGIVMREKDAWQNKVPPPKTKK